VNLRDNESNLYRVLDQVKQNYEKLVLVVGGLNTGKTSFVRKFAEHSGHHVLNFNLEISKCLLQIHKADRQLKLKEVVQGILEEQNQNIVFLDNTEILFDVQLQVNPLRLLKDLSRNQVIVATWNGRMHNGQLLYAKPGHPEHRAETNIDFPIIDLNEQRNYDNKEGNA